MTHSKKLLFICNQPPYGNILAREALDAMLACSAFEQDISVLFRSDAVYQLLGEQTPSVLHQKSILAVLKSFDLYEINKIFVCQHSLESRHINPAQLAIKANVINAEQIITLMENQDCLLNY